MVLLVENPRVRETPHPQLKPAMRDLTALAITLSLCGACAAALAHPKLVESSPNPGAAVDGTTPRLALRFSEPIEPAFFGVKLIGPGESAIRLDKPTADATNAALMVGPLPPLRPGIYRLEWSALGRDGHKVKGDLRFTVK